MDKRKIARAIGEALIVIADNPGELSSPGITKHRQNYQALVELHRELIERFKEKSMDIPNSLEMEVKIGLNYLKYQIKQADDGHLAVINTQDADRILSNLATMENRLVYFS